jgi:hypothetical protein
MTINTTPAVAQGITDHPWLIQELLIAAASMHVRCPRM